MSTQPNINEMTAAQIKEFIEAGAGEAAGEVTPDPGPETEWGVVDPTEQPRDEKGRFVAAEPEGGEALPEGGEEPTEYLHREEVDLGEGGKEVFEGVGATPQEALEACLRKVVEGKRNASLKIREQAILLKQQQATAPAPPTFSAADELNYAQQLQLEPTKVIDEVLTRRFGMTPEQIAAKIQAAEQVQKERAADAAAVEFVNSTPDFYACPQNQKRMIRELNGQGLEPTVENIRRVYQELSADGLLVTKPAEAAPEAPKPRASGLSVRRTAAPTKSAVDALREARALSIEELRDRAGGYQY